MDKYLSISKSNLEYNIDYYIQNTSKDIIAVVKNNAYGHGVKEIAKIINNKVKMYAVSNIKEAKKLRKYTDKDILILDRVNDYKRVDNSMIITIISMKHLKELIKENIELRVHLKINISMKRKGILVNEVKEAISLINNSNLKLEGIYTHYSSYKVGVVKREFKKFREALKGIDVSTLMIHASSSISSLNFKENFTNSIRVGIGMYGLKKLDECMNELKVTTSLYCYSKSIYKIKCFDRFSYHNLYIGKKGYVVMSDIGYGDGLFSNKFIGYHNHSFIKEIGNRNMDNMYFYSKDYIFDNTKIEIFGNNISLDKYCKRHNIPVCKALALLNSEISKKIE